MKSNPEQTGEQNERPGGLLALALLAPIVGTMSGLLGAIFRLALERADRLSNAAIIWGHGPNVAGMFLVVAACAGGAGLAAWMVRRFSPSASGSGIHEVEAVLEGERHYAPCRAIPVKFLRRVASYWLRACVRPRRPKRPDGGEHRALCWKNIQAKRAGLQSADGGRRGRRTCHGFQFASRWSAFRVGRIGQKVRAAHCHRGARRFLKCNGGGAFFLGDTPDFHVQALAYPSNVMKPLFVVLGVLAGFAAIAYNRAIPGALSAADRLHQWPVELRTAIIGGAVGMLAWFAPNLVGGVPVSIAMRPRGRLPNTCFMASGVVASLCSKTISPASFKTQYALERSPRSTPMVSFPLKMFFPLVRIVLIFCIAGLLSLCFEHVHHWELNASRGRAAFSSHLSFRAFGPVGVGIVIAHDPLHRSGRAVLPHPAPTLGDNAEAHERIGMTDTRRRKPALDVSPHAAPRQVVASDFDGAGSVRHRRPTALRNAPSAGPFMGTP